MKSNGWTGPWKCAVCSKTFKCQSILNDCHNREQADVCYCYEHTLFRSREEKLRSCRVEPVTHSSKPRKGKFISGTELLQI